MSKTALVIRGGGSKGSFAVGALRYLLKERGVHFDIVAGTSTGALIGPMVAARGAGALPTLEKEYTTVRTEDIVRSRGALSLLTGASSLKDSKPLAGRIEKQVTPEIARDLFQSKVSLFLTTVNLKTGRLVYFHTGPPAATDDGDLVEVSDREMLVRAMLTSSSIPVAMPPVEMEPGVPYVDGGVREYAPVKVAIDAGARDSCVIVLGPEPKVRPPYRKKPGNLLDVLQRAVDLLSEEVGHNDLRLAQLYTDGVVWQNAARKRLMDDFGLTAAQVEQALSPAGAPNPFAGKTAVSLRIIRPRKMLEGDTLEFDPVAMKANLEYGYQCAKEQWPDSGNVFIPNLFIARSTDAPDPVVRGPVV